MIGTSTDDWSYRRACAPRQITLVLHAITQSSTICSGKRATSAQYGTGNRSERCSMYTFAGVTASVSSSRPTPDAVLERGQITPSAPSSSKTPLVSTVARGQGIYG